MPGRTRLTGLSPVFQVRDLLAALSHYEALGFAVEADEGGAAYGFAGRDGISLHLAANPDPAMARSEAYLYVRDADALYEEWTAPGIGGTTDPVGDTDYGMREGAHVDPDGNVLRFGSTPPRRRWLRLRSHLEDRYGIEVVGMAELGVDVFRIDRRDGPPWVARRYPLARPAAATAADAEVLAFLAEHDFPAERAATAEPVSSLEGQAVLVTGYVETVRRGDRRPTIRAAGGLRHVGELLGRLHTLPAGPAVPTAPKAPTVSTAPTAPTAPTGSPGPPAGRRGGAWHHLAEGGPGEEIAVATAILARAGRPLDPAERRAYESLRAELGSLDQGAGLPEALIHPDLVLSNVVASPGPALVVVAWAGAGWGPRSWSLGRTLYAEGAGDLQRVDRIVAGYRSYVDPTPEELSRLAAVARARETVLRVWEHGLGRRTLTETAREVARVHEVADAVAERARAAFAAPGRVVDS